MEAHSAYWDVTIGSPQGVIHTLSQELVLEAVPCVSLFPGHRSGAGTANSFPVAFPT